MGVPLPQALHDRARRLFAIHGTTTTAAILGLHYTAIWRMRKRGWKQGQPGRRRPIPSDFAIQARHMTHAELVAHYRAGTQTVTRWLREKPARPLLNPGKRPRGKTSHRSDPVSVMP
jgi:hypothetical protein